MATIIGAMVAAGFVPPAADRIRYQLGIAVSIALRHSRRIRCRLISRPRLYRRADVGYSGRGLPENAAPASRRLSGVAGSCDRNFVDYHGMGWARPKASPRYVGLNTDTASGCCPDHHQHYADIQCSAAYADAGHSLLLLILLALGTFLAGLNLHRFRAVFSVWLSRSQCRRPAGFDIPCFSSFWQQHF